MKKTAILLPVSLLFSIALIGQTLISSTYKGAKSKNQLISQFGIPFIQYGAKYYKITYTSPDVHGVQDTMSGLLVIPDNTTKTYPRLVYQHGTSDCKTCVPSRYGSTGGGEGEVGLLCAGMGYVSLLPDYAGMGDARGFHPYVHAATEASAAADMLRASLTWTAQNNVAINDQIFITGYSQGGHASMALHRYIDTDPLEEMAVTAAAHNSGPYSISGVMGGLIQGTGVYFYPAYIPNTVLGYQTAYGNLYDSLAQVFKPAYIPKIQQYYNGTISLSSLNSSLIQLLVQQTGASVPGRILQDSILTILASQPEHPLSVALRANDVYNWSTYTPTRIFYCTADDQVPYTNSIIARDTMTANGSTDLQAIDVNPNANHGSCYNPAMTQTLLFFANFQQITTGQQDLSERIDVTVSPNPANDVVTLKGAPDGSNIELYDMEGQLLWHKNSISAAQQRYETHQLPVGNYLMRIMAPNGGITHRQLVIVR